MTEKGVALEIEPVPLSLLHSISRKLQLVLWLMAER
jgi:hypothetical protein